LDKISQQPSSIPPQHPAPRTLFTSSHIAIFTICLVATLFGLVVGWLNPLVDRAASNEGVRIDALFGVLTGLSAAIFIIVDGSLLYVLIRFGRGRAKGEAQITRAYLGLEVFWTAVPFIIMTGLAIYSYTILTEIDRPSENPLIIEVTARQWAWQFHYPDQDVTSSELHLPHSRQVLLKMHSLDVLHALWIPAFRLKEDIMPDRATEMRFTANKVGTFPLVCTRICGVGHDMMRTVVVVHELADFEAWLAQTADKTQAAGEAASGKQLFQKQGCGSCHTLSGAQAVGRVGPNLDGIGSRAGTTVLGQSAEAYIREAIINPDAYILPGYSVGLMPKDFQQMMSSQELQTLVQYLLAQK
jgi:cytochrome c oxidase subunit II